QFTLGSVAALYSSMFGQGFSSQQRQAAARSLLKHDVQNDGEHYKMRKSGGLHPSYISFHSKSRDEPTDNEQFLVESSGDIFDAIAMQDRLDGGMSVLLRCPGAELPSGISPQDIAIDIYVTPRELRE
ncbi:hypothetical protein BJ138DRAFT_974969, partial [Hygrophoropsis aurantiaca]